MDKRIVQVFYGPGKGKTSAAVGQCIRAACLGQSVIIIQFLKGNGAEGVSFFEKMEPEIKLFRFEREQESFARLSAARQKEEKKNILNGVNFARKVIDTGGCDVLVLDEILDLVDLNIITVEDVIHLIDLRDDYVRLVLTGEHLPEGIAQHADIISRIEREKS